ncbi:MAG: hypothetical protein HOO86_14195 [Bacteroidales bacterium]|nr:hypothetical protein [Bacteroidales bacterium]
MKTSLKFIVGLIVFIQALAICHAQQIVPIDLSKKANDIIVRSVSPFKSIDIEIINRLPSQDYQVIVITKLHEIETLSFPNSRTKADEEQIKCDILLNLIESINAADEESKLPKLIGDLEKEMNEVSIEPSENTPSVSNCITNYIEMAKVVIASTMIKVEDVTLNEGEDLEITIIRKLDDGTSKVWKVVYTTQKRGKWLTSWGFSFIGQVFNVQKLYFTKFDTSSYVITKEENRGKLIFAPTVFFTWMPTKNLSRNFSLSYTGGLGFDMEAPTVFVGGSLTYNQNISIAIGIVAHRQEFLSGEFKENQIVKENLSKDQLHNELYTVNPFVSLIFRFGENPFTNKEK